ncbi:MAG: protein kinase [Fimbriimonadia bacterium]
MITRQPASLPQEEVDASKLGDILIASGALTPAELRQAERRSRTSGERLSRAILETGAASPSQIIQALGLLYGLEIARFDQCPLDAAATACVPEDLARQLEVIPLRRLGSTLSCAIFDPGDTEALEALENVSDCAIALQVATPAEIAAELDRRYGIGGSGPQQVLPVRPGDMFLHYRLSSVRWEEPGVVWFEADDTRLLRRVTVAVLCPDLDDTLARRAGRVLEHSLWLARFPHRNVLTIHDVGEADGLKFIVSEAVHGETLRERLQRERKFSLAATCEIGLQLCDGLRHLHRHQLVYKALSPSNCALLSGDEVKLTHLGLGFEPHEVGDEVRLLEADDFRYRAPEYIAGEPLDPRADIFSLGTLLYEMAAGRPAFPGAGVAAVTRLILEGGLAACEELPPALNRIILRACAAERHGRYRDALSLAEDLLAQHWPEVAAGAGVSRYLAAVERETK